MGRTARRVPLWLLAPAAAAGWWVVGFLPRVVRGEAPGPLAAAPMATLVSFCLIGGVAGGAVAGLRRDRRTAAEGAVVLGVVAAALVGLALASPEAAQDQRVTTGLRVIGALVTVVGLGLGLLAALGPAVLRGAALTAPAVCLPGWLDELLPGELDVTVGRVVLALALAGALAVTVRRSAYELVGWLPAWLVGWTMQAALPALVTVAVYIRPGYGLDDATSLVPVGWDYLKAAWRTPDAHQPVAWVGGALLALLVVAWRLWARSRAPQAEPSD